MATSTAAMGKVHCIVFIQMCVCLADVSCSWPMLLGGDGELRGVDHSGKVCAMSHCSWDMLLGGVLHICVML